MPRSEWATEPFIYLYDISQTDSVKRYCACTALVTDCLEDSSFLVAGQRIDYPAHRKDVHINNPVPSPTGKVEIGSRHC